MGDIDVMRRRVSRLLKLADCLQQCVLRDVGLEQIQQLDAMSSELDAMRLTCIDLLKLSDRSITPTLHAVCRCSQHLLLT